MVILMIEKKIVELLESLIGSVEEGFLAGVLLAYPERHFAVAAGDVEGSIHVSLPPSP